MAPVKPLDPFRDIRITALVGGTALLALLGTVGVWAATAPLSGAVIAQGQVVVESNVRRIQHPTGGVVGQILVNDGDRVKAGDVLVRLDETTARANLAMVDNQLNQLGARRARLEAERDGRAALVFPPSLADHADQEAIASILAGEQTLFASRRAAREGQISQLRERIAQTREEISGLAAQVASKREQIRLIELELEGVRKLYAANLVSISRMTSLEREAARLSGEAGQLVAETARAKGRITETELQIIQIDQEQRREVSTELRDVETRLADFAERRVAALDQLQRIELRAPQDGVVHQKAVHTVGGVVSAGEQMMLIVPEHDGLVIEARIEPQLIDRLKAGQNVILRFSAFDSATTPDLAGVLTRISADLTRDQQNGTAFYVVRIGLRAGEHTRLAGKELVPGMPVEAFIQTGERTALAYLVKPVEDQLMRAFRHD
ncbi:HlyD family type I secretion periplasmic adaptor subunit [Xanthobacter sp. KR7-225]|uniref:HlyD family type I secretion periplasmic adaptor subunit n=1 Tax=Xanthobacter sp. KR7-225 TaxID=3156613 RepID=UPI0032B4073A